MRNLHALLLLLAFGLALSAWPDVGDAAPPNPAIAVEDLRISLRPLRKQEVSDRADAWVALLRAKNIEIAELRLQGRAPGTTQPAEDHSRHLARLNEEKASLILRVEAVLRELELKGGDTAELRTYLRAVSGVDVDLTDSSAVWHTAVGWLKSPEGGLRWLVNLIRFAATLLVFWMVARLAGGAAKRAVGYTRGASELMRKTMVSLAYRSVMLVGIVVALSMLEVNISPLLAAIGAAGLVLGLALQGTISNFASGLMILFYKPFDVGDAVKIGDVLGQVESMSIVSTVIRTFDNQRIMVPNNTVWGGIITNINANPTRRVDMTFSISYKDDMARACAILEEMLRNDPRTLPEPAPVVKVHTLGSSSVDIICRPWVKSTDYWGMYWDMTRKVKERFDNEGITIPFPQQDVHLFRHP